MSHRRRQFRASHQAKPKQTLFDCVPVVPSQIVPFDPHFTQAALEHIGKVASFPRDQHNVAVIEAPSELYLNGTSPYDIYEIIAHRDVPPGGKKQTHTTTRQYASLLCHSWYKLSGLKSERQKRELRADVETLLRSPTAFLHENGKTRDELAALASKAQAHECVSNLQNADEWCYPYIALDKGKDEDAEEYVLMQWYPIWLSERFVKVHYPKELDAYEKRRRRERRDVLELPDEAPIEVFSRKQKTTKEARVPETSQASERAPISGETPPQPKQSHIKGAKFCKPQNDDTLSKEKNPKEASKPDQPSERVDSSDVTMNGSTLHPNATTSFHCAHPGHAKDHPVLAPEAPRLDPHQLSSSPSDSPKASQQQTPSVHRLHLMPDIVQSASGARPSSRPSPAPSPPPPSLTTGALPASLSPLPLDPASYSLNALQVLLHACQATTVTTTASLVGKHEVSSTVSTVETTGRTLKRPLRLLSTPTTSAEEMMSSAGKQRKASSSTSSNGHHHIQLIPLSQEGESPQDDDEEAAAYSNIELDSANSLLSLCGAHTVARASS